MYVLNEFIPQIWRGGGVNKNDPVSPLSLTKLDYYLLLYV